MINSVSKRMKAAIFLLLNLLCRTMASNPVFEMQVNEDYSKPPVYDNTVHREGRNVGGVVAGVLESPSAPKASKSLKWILVLIWIAIAVNFLLILGGWAVLYYKFSELDGQISPIVGESVGSRNNVTGLPGPPGPQGQRGLKGDSGDQGLKGDQGLQGNHGDPGVAGPQGAIGPQGPHGLPGVQGPYGHPGVTGPQGPKGDAGQVGPQGLQGLLGAKGQKGDLGPQGLQGLEGRMGTTGSTGPQGTKGAKGSAGLVGPRGEKGVQGPQGPAGATGQQGQKGMVGETGLMGPQGDIGAQGPLGPAGPNGQKGDLGPQGIQGHKGTVGATGPQGPKGAKGLVGATGQVGPQGNIGAKGSRGFTGESGPKGQKGETGIKGEQGVQGSRGLTGLKGQKGSTGAKGIKGAHGPPGAAQGGVTYTRWGSSTCPSVSGTQLVYSGYAAGSFYSHGGGGANYICAPTNPQYGQFRSGFQGRSRLYGSEYELPIVGTHEHNVPCAVCLATTRGAMHMFPARTSCPTSWTLEYTGWLMSEHDTHKRSMYECVDRSQESLPGSFQNLNGALFDHVEVDCGYGLPCPPYVEQKEVLCVVCTK